MTKPEKHAPRAGSTLPDGWRWAKLREVIREAQAGFACGQRDPQGVVQLRMNNLNTRGQFIWDDILRVPRGGNDIQQFLLLPGDVIFNNTNSTELVGKSALFEGYNEPVVYSNHFTRLRTVSDALHPALLSRWLNHEWRRGIFESICNRWIGQSAVKADKLLNLEIPLPPLPEQRRIAGILNEQMAAVEKARLAAEAQLEAAKALPAACLRQVFPQPGQPLPAGWRWVKLGEVCEAVTGGTPPRSEPHYFTGKIPWIKPEHLDLSVVVTQSTEYLTNEGAERAGLLPEGSVLVSCIGKIGKTAIAGVPLTTNQQINSLIPGDGVDSKYLYYCCRSIRGELEQAASTALVSILNKSSFAAIKIPLPSLAEQKRIAGTLSNQMAGVEKLRASIESQLAEINALPAALLRQAFNGEL